MTPDESNRTDILAVPNVTDFKTNSLVCSKVILIKEDGSTKDTQNGTLSIYPINNIVDPNIGQTSFSTTLQGCGSVSDWNRNYLHTSESVSVTQIRL